jgi:hypothetical protein
MQKKIVNVSKKSVFPFNFQEQVVQVTLVICGGCIPENATCQKHFKW